MAKCVPTINNSTNEAHQASRELNQSEAITLSTNQPSQMMIDLINKNTEMIPQMMNALVTGQQEH
jgi:hypothetical protein